MATYSKLVVDLDPAMYRELCALATRRKTSRAAIVRGLLASHLVEIESEPSGKMFTAPLRETAKKAAAKAARRLNNK